MALNLAIFIISISGYCVYKIIKTPSSGVITYFLPFFFLLLGGWVNGGDSLEYTTPAAFASYFIYNQYFRIAISILLALAGLILVKKYKLQLPRIIPILYILPFFMGLYLFVGLGEGMSKGILGILVRLTDIWACFILPYVIFRVKGERFFSVFIFYLFCSLVVLSIISWIFEPENVYRGNSFRSVMMSAAQFADYIGFALIVILNLILYHKLSVKLFIGGISLLLIGLLLLYMSSGRAAFLACFLTFMFCYLNFHSSTRKVISVSVILLFFVFISNSVLVQNGATQAMGNTLMNTFENPEDSDTRTGVWQRSIRYWEDNVLLGAGSLEAGCESSYISMLGIYGVIGLMIFLTQLVSYGYFIIIRNIRHNRWALLAFSILIYLSVLALFEAVLLGAIGVTYCMFYIVFAGVACTDYLKIRK